MVDVQQPAPGAGPPQVPAPPPLPPLPPVGETYPLQPSPGRKSSSRWLVPLLVGVLALLIGVGVGYAVGVPAANSAKDDKTAAVQRADQLQSQLDQSVAASTGAQSAKERCATAMRTSSDLVEQFNNLLSDSAAWAATSSGSAAEATWEQHMRDQTTRMEAQYELMKVQVADCQAALG